MPWVRQAAQGRSGKPGARWQERWPAGASSSPGQEAAAAQGRQQDASSLGPMHSFLHYPSLTTQRAGKVYQLAGFIFLV